ncbi:MAG: alpha/beta fold hydrolase [Alphaproteobacteria bacterium]|nr:alpha/beta fold hydrolase [Alphaproteobacteria bacterium]
MTHFTLVHGAWHGAWCWQALAKILQAQGHSVSCITQTGLGERAGELSPDITLQTFVDDVVGYFKAQDIRDTVLVGHSFGGIAITGAAAVMSDRIAELVYLDAMVPLSGVAPSETVAPDVWAARKAGAVMVGETLCLPPPKAIAMGLTDPTEAAFIEAHMTPHPIRTYETAITFNGAPNQDLPVRYIRVTNPIYTPLQAHRDRVAEMGWPSIDIASGHDCMINAPDALADILLNA